MWREVLVNTFNSGPLHRLKNIVLTWLRAFTAKIASFLDSCLRKPMAFRDTTNGTPQNYVWKTSAWDSILMTCSYPYLGCASDWMMQIYNLKHCPDLVSDTSSVWNFCACFSDINDNSKKRLEHLKPNQIEKYAHRDHVRLMYRTWIEQNYSEKRWDWGESPLSPVLFTVCFSF